MYSVIRVVHNYNTGSISYYSGDTLLETRTYVQQILSHAPPQKRACMEEIRNRYIFRLEILSRGVLMILERNDRDFLNSMRRTWPFNKEPEKPKINLVKSHDPSDCVICLEMCGKNNRYKLTCECRYSCHKKCLKRWLKVSNNCPFCKI